MEGVVSSDPAGQAGLRVGDREPPPAPAPKRQTSADSFLAHLFRGIDPAVAASFTPEQQDALLTMFGHRRTARHPIDLRLSLPLGRHRFYFVCLMGRDRRLAFERCVGLRRAVSDWVARLALSLSLLGVLFALALLLKA